VASGHKAFAAKLDHAAHAYASAGLPLVFRVTPFSEPGQPPGWLDQQLSAAGLQRFDTTHVLQATLATLPDPQPWPNAWHLAPVSNQEFARVVGALRGTPEAQQQGHAARLLASPVPYAGAVVRDAAGQVLACGQTAQEAGLLGLYDVYTAPAARNGGLARLLCAKLLHAGRQAGATHAYLQVDAGNAPALQVYRRLGFSPLYDYHYRTLDPAAA
jgi:ribosomal protein S18 acetylase RimI-like enzyme